MSFQGNGVTFLNFDHTYASQKQLFHFPHEWIDLTDLSHTNLYCEPASLREIERRIRLRKQKGAVFIGNGNYHYVSYLLIQEIKEPFTLVLFDHHTDVGAGDDPVISCGSWVSYALKHPYLKRQSLSVQILHNNIFVYLLLLLSFRAIIMIFLLMCFFP